MVLFKDFTGAEKQITIGSELFKYAFDKKTEKIETLNPTDIPLETYTEMLNDAGIIYPLWILKLPIIRNAYHYENEDKDIENFVRKNLARIWARTIAPALTSFEYGFAAFEKRFEVIDGLYWYKTPVDLLPNYIKIKITNDGSFDGLKQEFPGRSAVDVPIWKSFVVTHDKRFGNHYGRARLRAAHRYWLMDKSEYNFHAIAAQDFAVPTTIGRAPTGQTPISHDDKGNPVLRWNLDIIQDMAEGVHSKSALSFPSGDDWKLELLSEKKTVFWDFNKDHEWLDRMKARAIFIPEEIVLGKGGSYAKTEVQSRWLEEMIEAIQDDLAGQYFMPFLIEPLVWLNFFNGKTPPPLGRLFFSPLAEADREFLQRVFEKAFLAREPFELDFAELARQFSVPIQKSKQPKEKEESMMGRIARALKTSGKISELDRKFIMAELRRAYNTGIEKIKSQTGFEGYVGMRNGDIVFIDQEVRDLEMKLRNAPNISEHQELVDAFFLESKTACHIMGKDAAQEAIRRIVP